MRVHFKPASGPKFKITSHEEHFLDFGEERLEYVSKCWVDAPKVPDVAEYDPEDWKNHMVNKYSCLKTTVRKDLISAVDMVYKPDYDFWEFVIFARGFTDINIWIETEGEAEKLYRMVQDYMFDGNFLLDHRKSFSLAHDEY